MNTFLTFILFFLVLVLLHLFIFNKKTTENFDEIVSVPNALDLTGQNNLCPNQYNKGLGCGPGCVNISTIDSTNTKFQCTNPGGPWNKLNICPTGTTMSSDKISCICNAGTVPSLDKKSCIPVSNISYSPAPYPVYSPAPYPVYSPVSVLEPAPAPYPVYSPVSVPCSTLSPSPAPYPVSDLMVSFDSDKQQNLFKTLIKTINDKINNLLDKTTDQNYLNTLKTILKAVSDISINISSLNTFDINLLNTLTNYLSTINSLEETILGLYQNTSVCSTGTNQICLSIVPLKYKYKNVGCYDKVPNSLFTNFYGKVKDLEEATRIANNYGATVFGLTDDLNIYLGFSYNPYIIYKTCTKKTMDIYAAIVTKLENPSVYLYTKFGVIDGNNLTDEVSKIFNDFDSSLKVGKADTEKEGKEIANKYGATAFYIDKNKNVYITYNFNLNSIVKYANTTSKSGEHKNVLYYARFRTKPIQLNNELYCNDD